MVENENIRYSSFEIVVTQSQYMVFTTEIIELFLEEFFFKYSMEYSAQGTVVRAFGGVKIRKRASTFESDVKRILKDLNINENQSKYINCFGLRGQLESYRFDNDKLKGDFIDSSEYEDRKDIENLEMRANRYPWQNSIYDFIYDDNWNTFIPSDYRTVVWVKDKNGNVGKSKFVKWFCFNFPDDVCRITFGSPSQLRNSMINVGAKKVYFVDIPRTRGSEDSLPTLISILEDIKNGFVTGVMYGVYYRNYWIVFNRFHTFILIYI